MADLIEVKKGALAEMEKGKKKLKAMAAQSVVLAEFLQTHGSTEGFRPIDAPELDDGWSYATLLCATLRREFCGTATEFAERHGLDESVVRAVEVDKGGRAAILTVAEALGAELEDAIPREASGSSSRIGAVSQGSTTPTHSGELPPTGPLRPSDARTGRRRIGGKPTTSVASPPPATTPQPEKLSVVIACSGNTCCSGCKDGRPPQTPSGRVRIAVRRRPTALPRSAGWSES